MDLGIRGKRALVTASSRGLGRGCALALAEAGVDLVLNARGAEALAATAAAIRATHGVGVVEVAADVTSAEGRAAVLNAAGEVDILVTNAGGPPPGLWSEWSREDFIRALDANMLTPIALMQACLPGMMARGWGRIINIGSTAASVGWKDNPAYCASKAGLLGLTRCVALEGAPHGVSCVMISPTWVETELMRRNVAQLVAREGKGRTLEDAMADIAAENPQQRIIQPSEVASLAAYLCRQEARGITAENIQITGGALW